MDLAKKLNIVVTHYGCSDLNKTDNTIFWIGAIAFVDDEKVYFFENGNELEILEKYKLFIQNHKSSTFIHWSMNAPAFGFLPIQKRYKELTNIDFNFKPEFSLDLSEFLKIKYGIYYVNRKGGRLDNLAKLNGFSGFKNSVEVKDIFEASQRLELIFSIYQADSQDKLKVDIKEKHYENPHPDFFKSYGFELFKSFNESIQADIKLASISFLVDQLKRDSLMNPDKSLIDIFNFIVEKLDLNLGAATKFKSNYSSSKYLPVYKEIKKRYSIVPK